MKVLVTGASGFVGSHLCELLHKNGHEVFALARNKTKFEHYSVPGRMIQGELSINKPNSWADQLPEDLDTVIHTAGVVHSFNPKTFYEINHFGTKQLVTDLKKLYKSLNFVLISSLAASGPSADIKPIEENQRPAPVSHYGLSKLRSEEVLKYIALPSWKKIIVRPPMVMGPRDMGILSIFKMVRSGVTLIPGMNGNNKLYSFICVHDLTNMALRAIELAPCSINSKQPEIYFCSHPEMVSLGEIIHKIQNAMNKKTNLKLPVPSPFLDIGAHALSFLNKLIPSVDARLTPDKVNEMRPAFWTCCSKKSQKLLKMDYQWNLDKTIALTLDDYIKRGLIKSVTI